MLSVMTCGWPVAPQFTRPKFRFALSMATPASVPVPEALMAPGRAAHSTAVVVIEMLEASLVG